VIQREREVDEKLVAIGHCSMVLFDNVVDVSNCGADEESKDESEDVMTSSPEVHVDGIEEGEEWESPRDAVNNCFLAIWEELVYDSTKKKDVNKRPDEECPGRRSDVCLISIVVYG